MTRKALILAAGRGRRLLPITKNKPKPMVSILGKPIIEYVIDTLKQASVEHLIIVIGYKYRQLRNFLGNGSRFGIKIQYSLNSDFYDGNATSLRAGQEFVEDDELFLLLMADHLIDTAIIGKALMNSNNAPLLCVDKTPYYPPQTNDATKVLVNPESFIRDIGKDISLWNGIDTGVFLLNSKIFQIIETVAINSSHSPLTLSRCLKQMISEGNPLWACDVSGSFWLDIDTLGDLLFAEKLLMRYSSG